MFEYKYYTGASLAADLNETKLAGYRWYRKYSGSIVYWSKTGTQVEDAGLSVGSWIDFTSFLNISYTGVGSLGGADWPYYQARIRGANRDVALSGKIRLATGAELPLNTLTTIGTISNTSLRPVTDKLFQTFAGTTTTVYSITRITINTAGVVQYHRMGANTATANDKYLCLDGIRYATEGAA